MLDLRRNPMQKRSKKRKKSAGDISLPEGRLIGWEKREAGVGSFLWGGRIMSLLVRDPTDRDQILAKRRASGGDRYDEVWEGQCVMSPLAADEHQRIVGKLTTILELVVGMPGQGEVRAGINLSDRTKNWEQNYRVPDVAVRLEGGAAQIHEAHWSGGPGFVVEVMSPYDGAQRSCGFTRRLGHVRCL